MSGKNADNERLQHYNPACIELMHTGLPVVVMKI